MELFRLLESKYVVDFTGGLGLGAVWLCRLFRVTDAGSLGGGMSLCFESCFASCFASCFGG